MENTAPILEVGGFRKSFGPVEALRGVDLTLHAGEVLAVVGDNGAGKSTLIKHISSVYRRDAGEMRMAGKPVNFSTPREAREAGVETNNQNQTHAEEQTVGAN